MTRTTTLTALAVLCLGGLFIATAAAQDTLAVTEIILGSELENGVPTTPSTSFARNSGAVYCMVRLTNPSRAEGAVRISFERAEGEPATRQSGRTLTIPARPRYRTVARSGTARAAGTYRCVVRAEDGSVLSHADYTITE